MAVSYNLNVQSLSSLENFSAFLVSSPDDAGIFDRFRFWEVGSALPQIFPTGEYIIRKGMYINGFYVYVGSYKAYCVDLFGAGNDGYAWDGFILTTRGYSLERFPPLFTPPSTPAIPNPPPVPDPQGFGFLPMRMMYEVNPGAIGDATAIANDSSVGLYGLDVFKDLADVTVTASDPNIRIITCGKQRINASVENAPTGMDYVGNLYMGILLQYDSNDEEAVMYRGDALYKATGIDTPYNFMQLTWRANDANHIDKTNVNGRFNRTYNLEDFLAVVEGVGTGLGAIWDAQTWMLAPHTPPSSSLATDANVFPRSFLDITCVSELPDSLNTIVGSPFLIVGEASLDSNNNGTADKKVPMALACAYPYPEFVGGVYDAGPYMNMNPAIATSLSAEPTLRWQFDGDAPAYNLENAQAVFCSQPYEALTTAPPFFPDFFPQTLIAINNIDFSGTTYGAIYTTDGSFVQPRFEVLPLAVHNGAFATATGINLPTKFYAKAIQQRTFSISEEDIAKQGQLSLETGEFTPNIPGVFRSVFDSDAQEYIGFFSNYQRYGAFDLSDPSVIPTAEAGDLTGSGYGFLGILDGVGPSAIMFDSGSPRLIEETGQPLRQSIVVRQEGGNLNANTLSNPTSTTRKIVNCGWDNDRDQWLFIGSDTNDVSVLSVSSDFSTASNNVGFLDQTNSFGTLDSGTDAGFYFPISMSNSLDGWVWFGSLDDGLIGGIKPASLGASSSYTYNYPDGSGSVTYDVYLNATTQIFRVTGTSGRTARVWVDYVLFDGPDALIANKLKERGMKVSIEAVEWFKRQIIQTGDLNITAEEIEMWMRDQQDEYKQTLKEIERQGRLRRRKKQVSAYLEGVEEQINPDFMDTEVKDFVETFTPETRPPTPEEARIEKKKKGGYSPEQDSYYDEVFED